MKQIVKILILITCITWLVGCSTMNMERKLAAENKIDTETYGYDDEEFIFQEAVVQDLATRFRLEELTTENVNSIMEDEIEAGYYNEVIIYLRYLLANEEEQAAMFTERYYEALLAHVQQVQDPSPQLLADAIESAKRQYELDPTHQRNAVHYASLLLHTNEQIETGMQILFDLEEELLTKEEDFNKQTIQALALAYMMDEQYEESIEHYLTLASLDPEDALVFYNISYVLEQMGEFDQANDYLLKAYSPTTEFLETYGTEAFGLYQSFFSTATKESE
ncbi:tetratricopeptide repeat protein [Bacillus solitudinis]|uniref:hypothetical protein n=1 Tax=Bacillus solitudinis TaxID=2014074 RepID=UPI000C24E5CD|nr:hypothetical protein [Bacillus solitudinis]